MVLSSCFDCILQTVQVAQEHEKVGAGGGKHTSRGLPHYLMPDLSQVLTPSLPVQHSPELTICICVSKLFVHCDLTNM